MMLGVLDGLPDGVGDALRERCAGRAAVRRRAGAVRRRVPAHAGRQGRTCSRTRSTRESPPGLYRYQPDPASARYPLALISPSSERTISSTLGELPRPTADARHASRRCAARGMSSEGDTVRIFNDAGRGALPRCRSRPTVRPGTVALPKGLWRPSTRERLHGQRPGARHADRHRRRRLLQRRAGAGGAGRPRCRRRVLTRASRDGRHEFSRAARRRALTLDPSLLEFGDPT